MKKTLKFSKPSFFVAWLAGSLVTYFVLGFLKNFYTDLFSLAVWEIILQTGYVLIGYFLLRGIFPRFRFAEHGLITLGLLLAFGFGGAVIGLCTQFSRLFDLSLFLMPTPALPLWFGLVLASALWTGLLIEWMHKRGFDSNPYLDSLRVHLPGLLLAAAFFVVYFSLAVAYSIFLRDPSKNFDDNFYDTDPTSWMNRFAAPFDSLIEMRPVHPFAYLLFRPTVWFLSLFLHGDRFYAALMLNAGVGALCVFLAWTLLKRWTNPVYALLCAALLGASAAHLILGTFLETYIYSAAALILFLFLLQRGNRSLAVTIPAGLLVFGITISNFLQTCVYLVFHEPKIFKTAKYIAAVIALGAALAYVQVSIFPTSQPFYNISDMLSERRYSFDIFTTPIRQTLGRGYSLYRTIMLYSTVAPRPLALTDEIGCQFPCFKTYKPHYPRNIITSYSGFGSWLARFWFILEVTALAVFLWKLFKSRSGLALQSALLVCVFFNFLLHMGYGDDPMLYSPDWTYAVIFFVALSFQGLADKKWFQAAGLVFLAAVMVNNWIFLRSMFTIVSPYLQ